MNLNANEQIVLSFLNEHYSSEGWCFSFRPIAAETGLDRQRVRRACRSLARKGLTEYVRGLWSDSGEPAGSGYCCTKAGHEVLANQPDTQNGG